MDKGQKGITPLIIPDVGDADQIELVSWNVTSGSHVKAGQELCELVTDKASFPLEAPFDGTIHSIKKNPGEEVHVGEIVAEIQPD
jgi:pyruvate/2-oxoglutarate dehydrogenase complex dihydrolipoamide acyltransferase (E2) component